MSSILFLTAADAGAATGGSMISFLIPLILIFVIMWFFMIRPQNKKQKEMEKQIAALKKGDKVVTIGGIHGTVAQTKENTLIIKVDDNCKMEFNRTAIATVVNEKDLTEAASKEKDTAKKIKEKGKDKKEEEKEENKDE